MSKNDTFKEISDLIAAQLEQGVTPWIKPWKAGMSPDTFMPHNATTGKNYRGANVMYLMAVQSVKNYESAAWLTFNQANKLKGHIKKGERGTPVFYWHFGTEIDKVTGEEKTTVRARSYTVFNIAQTEGVELPERKTQILTPAERNAKAESLIAATGAKIRHGGDSAFYMPSFDQIQMPVAEAFKSIEDYYSTLFHELGHWTGHESRLDRKFGAKFGDSAYAFEELVAELTSAFVCGANGFTATVREDHAQYIAGWIKKLREEPRAFIDAAGKAQKAADFIMAEASEESEVTETAEAA